MSDTPRCNSLDLNDHDFNDIRAWRKLARQLERELAHEKVLCANMARAVAVCNKVDDAQPSSLKIDHGSISLRCKPETIQLFVDRMTAAKVARIVEPLLIAGAKMSNWCFNVSQHPGRVLTDSDCQSLKAMQVEWDAALSVDKGESDEKA